jgi:fructoselysine-6-P-deglycase FrlB-like protein
MTLYSEIAEQPERIKSLLASQKKNVEQIVAAIQKRDIQYVFLAARGTSILIRPLCWGAALTMPPLLNGH